MNTKYEFIWTPQPGPQTWLIECPVFETLFGGARGGGKSDGVLGEWLVHSQQYGERAIGLCVRRERTQLLELIERSKVLFAPIGARFNVIDGMWRFPNGARLRFAYLENDSDAQRYQGHSYTRVYVEEMGTFPNPAPIFKLMATLGRDPDVPSRFIATANPGGPGHLWIKSRYIDPAPLGMKIIPTEFINPFTKRTVSTTRVFIPSKVTDNKYTNTSEYIANLYLAGHDNEDLIKAWLMGDWNVMLGSFFHEWDATKHIIKEFPIPKHWTRFMSMDFGSSRPFSIGWWCVVPDEFDVGNSGLDIIYRSLSNERLILPRGAIVRYREWYGNKPNTDNKNTGLKLSIEEIARGINWRERDEPKREDGRPNIAYRVADPSGAAQNGGPSFFERMAASPFRIILQEADNKRVPKRGAMGGWDMVRQRLKGEDGRPMMYFMDCCPDAIRTLPAMQHDENNPEDIQTQSEDHAPDEIRYACMSRPYSRIKVDEEAQRQLLKYASNSLYLHDNIEDLYSKVDSPVYNPRIN